MGRGQKRAQAGPQDDDAQIARLVDLASLRQAGVHVLADSMYGTGQGYFKRLLAGGQTTVDEIRNYVERHGESIFLYDDEGNSFPGGNDLSTRLMMTPDDERKLIEATLSGNLPDGRPAGVYLSAPEGELDANHPLHFLRLILIAERCERRGLLVGFVTDYTHMHADLGERPRVEARQPLHQPQLG